MQSIGQKLRNAREAQGQTIEDVNSAIRISVKILAAIEADDTAAVSSPFQYRSFVRQFAEHLHLDYAEIQPAVLAATDRIPQPLVPGEEINSANKIAALSFGRRRNFRWVPSLSALAVALVACSAFYAFWQNAKVNIPATWHRAVSSEVSAARPLSAPHAAVAAGTQRPADRVPDKHLGAGPGLSTEQMAAQPPASGFTLELSATEPAWLSIVADGKVSFKGILERAETKVLEGHRTARIRTGNAGAVEVVFNGKSLGALGSRGQVRTVVFTKNDYEVLERPGARISLVRFNSTFELSQLLHPRLLLPAF